MRRTREIAANIGFTEGPVWTRAGRLIVTSMTRGLVYELDLGGGVTGRTETGGGPNGLAEDATGAVWVAQNGGTIVASRSDRPAAPGLQRIVDGVVEDVVAAGLLAPNDLVEGPDGRIWFTDPGGTPGRVHAFDPRGGGVEELAGGIAYPNGLAFDACGEFLYVAETRTGRVLRYGWDGSTLQPLGVFATLSAGSPDGLAFDADGNLYAASPDADLVAVFDPDGREREPLRFAGPTFPTNLCFAGPELDVLVVTAAKGGRVLAVDAVAKGARPAAGTPVPGSGGG
ncbi:SMP-30/gluconolactonase/LRE family protein [Pseudonocardia sp.]|uniref:SMP-30/gluconolactonase/LRE family protein n=1 Tax=Pseudonocardia sp. TaxID=60912 RepID=UPI003D0F54F1